VRRDLPGDNAMHHIIHSVMIDVLRGWENFEHARRRLGFLRFSRYSRGWEHCLDAKDQQIILGFLNIEGPFREIFGRM
jgi:hypothetical protein